MSDKLAENLGTR